MASYINNPTFSDIIFLLEGKKEVFAHKMMISRCPYFSNMFKSEMIEKSSDKIKIEGVKHEVFLQVLKYLYTDDCDISFEVRLVGKLKERYGTV